MKNRDMRGNSQLSFTQGPQQSRFADTILAYETIPSAERHSQRSVSQYSLPTNGNINAINFDILAFGLVTAQL